MSSSYCANIDIWLDWWKGIHKPFHTYRETLYTNNTITRDMYTLRMAKKVCEDWASLLINEKTDISIESEEQRQLIEQVFNNNDFWSKANELIEKVFALGTGAFALRLTNDEISIAYITADCIIPISHDNKGITEVAFASNIKTKGKTYTYLETHLKNEKGNYVIKNEFFDNNFNKVNLFDDIIPEYDTKNNAPWFSILTPNIVNSVDINSPMGISVFANAIDVLKGVDLAYNNLCKDFKLGGKKVFIDKSLTQRDSEGRTITPDDIAQQLFVSVGDDMIDEDGSKLIHEFNPQLRVGENEQGIQAQLNYLSSKCGLGERYYSFSQGSVATATQIVSENSTLFRNIKKHEIVIEKALISLIKSILAISKHNQDTEVSIVFDDSIIEDKAAERQRDLHEVSAGLMQKWEYRVKWYGETEQEAKGKLPQMNDLMDGE